MLATMIFGGCTMLAVLALDLAVRRLAHRPDELAPGRRILQGARLLGLLLLAGTLATACRRGEDLLADIGWAAAFGLTGVLAFELALLLGLRLLAGLVAAARTDNLAAATAVAAHVIAIGILVANVFGGTSWAELGIAAASFAVGQVTLLLLLWLFRWLTTYDDRQALLAGNVAAALAHGGLTIALALVIAWATDGPYEGPWLALSNYGLALGQGLLAYPARQLLVQCLILRARPTLIGGELDRAIGERADVGAGALEAATYIGIALFVRSFV